MLHNGSVLPCKGGVANSRRAKRHHLHQLSPDSGSGNLVRKKRRESSTEAVACDKELLWIVRSNGSVESLHYVILKGLVKVAESFVKVAARVLTQVAVDQLFVVVGVPVCPSLSQCVPVCPSVSQCVPVSWCPSVSQFVPVCPSLSLFVQQCQELHNFINNNNIGYLLRF